MSENSIEFSLSNSEQRDSWLNSSHRTLDADTRTRFHFWALSALDLAYSLISFKSTLGHWSPWSVTTSIHSQALGLRGLCSQLGTAGGSVAPSLGVITETWPHNWVVSSRILVLFGINLMLWSIVTRYMQRSNSHLLRSHLDWWSHLLGDSLTIVLR